VLLLRRPGSAQEIANAVLHTVFMGTVNSSATTRNRAEKLAAQIGAYHHWCAIDPLVEAILAVFRAVTGRTPKFMSQASAACTCGEWGLGRGAH
jgi:NAD+ synthase (glutamine-hydrolysing)